MQILPRNRIEEEHLKALKRFGYQPTDWTFERQLSALRKKFPDWKTDGMQSLSRWSPSRFEFVELVPLYYLATTHIQTMQQMSKWALPATQFLIASDPSQKLAAYCNEHSNHVSRDDVGNVCRHIIWVNIGLINFVKVLANHFAWVLAGDKEGLIAAFDDVARTQDLEVLAVRFRDRRFPVDTEMLRGAYPQQCSEDISWFPPPFGRIEDLSPKTQTVVRILQIAMTTFVIGHEMGHIYLGHTGFHPRKLLITSQTLPFPAPFRAEIEADLVGTMSVFDGIAAEVSKSRFSIDFTWIAPLLYLSTMTGVALHYSDEKAQEWAWRLIMFSKTLVGTLQKCEFEHERIRRISLSLPTIAAATIEWMRLELAPSAPNDFSYIFLDQLRTVCGR
ncbi:MAG: hypothetical protein ABSB30_13050 [Terracidiphilus sp.]|jgi:hypothetical protein